MTVAVLPVPKESFLSIPPGDLDWKMTRGSGAGGQHRNVTDSAVQLTHKPSGIAVRCESERSQHQNKALALDVLRARLRQQNKSKARARLNLSRKDQVGTGMRADKVRTIALQRDQVVHHHNNKRMSAKKYLRGYIEYLWD